MGAYANMNPTLILSNQFGEKSLNSILGGSGAIQAKFTVDPTNASGVSGATFSPQISSIWMHTSTTPVAGSPNPVAGFMQINFAEGFLGFNAIMSAIQSPNSGTPILVTAGFTQGQAYTITVLGTTTASNWHSIGVPANVIPAVGVSFLAAAVTAGIGTGAVQVPTVSNLIDMEIVGNPVLTAAGGYVILQLLSATSTSNPTPVVKAPTTGTIFNLSLSLDAQIDGAVI